MVADPGRSAEAETLADAVLRPGGGDLPASEVGFFQDLAETIREAIYVTDVATTRVTYVNPAFERLFGFGLAELEAEPNHWSKVIHPDDVAYLKGGLERLNRNEAPRPHRMLRPDGTWRWVRQRLFSRHDRAGVLVRVVGLVEDISEEVERDADSRQVNESVRRMIEVLPVGILAYRQDRPVFANTALAGLLGVPVDELLHMSVRALVDTFFREDERQQGQRRLRQAKLGIDLPPVERHVTSRTGAPRVLELQTITVDLEGEAAQVTVLRDLTEQRRLEAQVAQADRMAAVGRIAAGVAHELNNPLSFVLGNLEMAREELPELLKECRILHGKMQQDAELAPRVMRLSERVQELTAVVHDASEGADRVRGIMRDLKSFSRPDTDDRRELVDLSRPLDAAVRMAWREIQPRARLIQDRQATPPVLGVEGRLCQVFLNLLVNAAEALPEGGSHAHEVRIRTATGPQGEAIVEIADTGPGIAPELRATLFEPFVTTKGPGHGTGLGLSICHDIVRAHGGQIEVLSLAGEGARFRITLPAAPGQTPGPTPEARPTRRGRMLVIDDEPVVAASLRQALVRDHAVTVVASGREALALIGSGERFDVIFCDVGLSEMSGLDLHLALMSAARDQCDRIVFVTGGPLTPVVREFLAQVPNRYLEKPFSLREVRETVAELLQ